MIDLSKIEKLIGMETRPKGFFMVFWNVRSMKHKVESLRYFAYTRHPEVMGISETWLKEKYPDTLVDFEGYIVHRQDRPVTAAGSSSQVSSFRVFILSWGRYNHRDYVDLPCIYPGGFLYGSGIMTPKYIVLKCSY